MRHFDRRASARSVLRGRWSAARLRAVPVGDSTSATTAAPSTSTFIRMEVRPSRSSTSSTASAFSRQPRPKAWSAASGIAPPASSEDRRRSGEADEHDGERDGIDPAGPATPGARDACGRRCSSIGARGLVGGAVPVKDERTDERRAEGEDGRGETHPLTLAHVDSFACNRGQMRPSGPRDPLHVSSGSNEKALFPGPF
jgi:hypothetical protein